MLRSKELLQKMRFWRPACAYAVFAKKDTVILELLKLQVAADYLNKHYVSPYFSANASRTIVSKPTQGGGGIQRICWVYWRQGFDATPPIVKTCVKSITAACAHSGWELRLLDLEQAKTMTDLPDYIWSKYHKGLIQDAHLSDLIRLNLLKNYGGCWLDATVYCSDTESLPKFLYAHDLFVFRNDYKNNAYINISNWCMYSVKHHPIIVATHDILLQYWGKEDLMIQYYGFHLIFKLVTDCYREYWSQLPIYSNVSPHLLQNRLLEPYQEDIVNEIFEISPIHKLMWRLPETLQENSVARYLCKANE